MVLPLFLGYRDLEEMMLERRVKVDNQLVAGFPAGVNLSGSLSIHGIPSTQPKATKVTLEVLMPT